MTLTVPHITDELDPEHVLAINLRQKAGQELDLVAFDEQGTFTEIVIDASNLENVDQKFTLVLESFDLNSNGVESTLKTDTVIVNVVKAIVIETSATLATQAIV